jgi:hypothetical protein
MNLNGEQLIDALCQKLKDDKKLCTDSQILILLKSLNRYEVNQIITFGTVDEWERDKTAPGLKTK